MIKVYRVNKEDKICCCDNCNRDAMPFVIMYEMYDTNKQSPWNKFCLCEDCSNALSNLHKLSMENGNSFKYDMDEITKSIVVVK